MLARALYTLSTLSLRRSSQIILSAAISAPNTQGGCAAPAISLLWARNEEREPILCPASPRTLLECRYADQGRAWPAAETSPERSLCSVPLLCPFSLLKLLQILRAVSTTMIAQSYTHFLFAQAMVEAPVSPFEALPLALHLFILSFLPFVERVRCALVSRSWTALLADPAFWTELRFDGAPGFAVDGDTLLQLCRRAGGRLRLLDISHPACDHISFTELTAVLATEGHGLSLESIRTWDPERLPFTRLRRHPFMQRRVNTAAEGAALLAACPSLQCAAVVVGGPHAAVPGAVSALPGPGEKWLVANGGYITPWSALAEWLPAAVAASPVSDVTLWGFDTATVHAAGAAERAAARLAEGLAAPHRGVRTLALFTDTTGTPLLESLCRALTAESPLTNLDACRSVVTSAGAAELAAALAPGRSRLKSLLLTGGDLSAGGGCVLFARCLRCGAPN